VTRSDLDSTSHAIHAISRLLAASLEAVGPEAVERALAREVRDFFGVTQALLISVADDRAAVAAVEPDGALAGRRLEGRELPPLEELLGGEAQSVSAGGEEAVALGRTLGLGFVPAALLFLPLRARGAVDDVLVLADEREREFTPEEVERAAAFAGAAAASLGQLRLAEKLAERVAQQSSLARAAQSLNESLDLPRLLSRISHEAAAILDAELAAVWRGDSHEGVAIEAVYGFPPEVVGYRLEPGEGIAGRVALRGESIVSNDYAAIAPPDSPFVGVQSVLGVPMRWEGELHGVLAVGYTRPHVATAKDLALLETFAELAAVACRNASVHAGLAHAARTDGLTGCLNHGALHEVLQREIERCRRAEHGLALVLLDLDDFKQVNELHGHLVGDEVLRRVGRALQQALRPYDHVGRYGGDEFAIVAVDSGEVEAVQIAERALGRLDAALADFGGDWPAGRCATAGVARWDPTLNATGLLAEADRALLFGKQEGGAGEITPASALPESFRPGRFRRDTPTDLRALGASALPAPGRQQLDRLRRRTRGLALATALASRLAAMTKPADILEAAVAELHGAFGYFLCAVLHARDDGYIEAVAARGDPIEPGRRHVYSQPRSAGLIGRCLRERQPVVSADVTVDPDYRGSAHTEDTRSEACAPIWVDGAIWGALNVESSQPDAFGEDEVRLLQTVADLLGSSLSSAFRHDRLDRELRDLRGES
jgi:diguanylate cyclase (GGDEF)-like protein